MPTLSVRIPKELLELTSMKAKEQGFSDRSEYVRYILEQDLYKGATLRTDWKMKVMTTLGIDAFRFQYAFKNSETADEFFSMVSRWSTVPISLFYDEDQLGVVFEISGKKKVRFYERASKSSTIKSVVDDLEELIMEDIQEKI